MLEISAGPRKALLHLCACLGLSIEDARVSGPLNGPKQPADGRAPEQETFDASKTTILPQSKITNSLPEVESRR